MRAIVNRRLDKSLKPYMLIKLPDVAGQQIELA
jgi:hypothetical protein